MGKGCYVIVRKIIDGDNSPIKYVHETFKGYTQFYEGAAEFADRQTAAREIRNASEMVLFIDEEER